MMERDRRRPPPVAGPDALAPGAAALADAGRLGQRRAVVLVAGFLLLWVAFQLAFGLPLVLATAALVGATPFVFSEAMATVSTTGLSGLALAVGAALGAVLSVALLRRRGGPPLAAMGLRREGLWLRELALGAALGPFLFALVLALELAFGWAKVQPGRIDAGGLVAGALTFTAVAVNEEVATRGFILQVLARAWNPAAGLVASSVLFTALHLLNPGAWPAAMVTLIPAGLVLGWGYLATGRLWLPIAFHWSWNFAQGPLFGFPVSGLSGDAVLAVTPIGPDWATGGAFGPEAGLLGLLGEAIVAAVILAWRRAGSSQAATAAVAGGGLAGLAFLVLVAR
jgi:membrane protease YdiL (CAAX protease family)